MTKPHDAPVDIADGLSTVLCGQVGAITPKDGLLLIQFDYAGCVTPHVLRLGTMTEGRLEAALMPIFNEIVKARVRLMNAERKMRQENNDEAS